MNKPNVNLKEFWPVMKEVIESLAEQLGSYAKAYDMCKTINVYTEDENPNNPEVERIIEPILQDALRKIDADVCYHVPDRLLPP